MDFIIAMICVIIGAVIGVFISALVTANSDERPANRHTNIRNENERK